MRDVVTLILGGGRGTRLFPLTKVRAKPAVPVGGKYRLIDIPISNSINSDLAEIYVLTQFQSMSLNRHITSTYNFAPYTRHFVQIIAAEQTEESQDWFQGTADAVRKIRNHIDRRRYQDVLILSGDHLYRMDYRDLLITHRTRRADVTVAVIPVSREQAPQCGILKADRQGRITEFVEKPSAEEELERLRLEAPADPDRPWIGSMGIYAFRREALMEELEDPSSIDFGKHIIPGALGRRQVFAHTFFGYWEDIGTIRAFFEANIMLGRSNAPFQFQDPEFPIYTRPRYLAPSRLEDCRVANSVISDGCLLEGSEIRDSVVGLRTVIGRGSRIHRTVIMGRDHFEADLPFQGAPPTGIGSECSIREAIIDKEARIGRGVKIHNVRGVKDEDGENYYIRDGVVIIPKGAVVPDGTEI